MPTPGEICTFNDAAEVNPWVRGEPPQDVVTIVPPDPSWSAAGLEIAEAVRSALGARALMVEHVGSTSVPGLAAKPVFDLDLTVADPADEAGYVPLLEPHGWWLCLREPAWYGHRLLRMESPRVNLHVWGPDSPEAMRHRLFRDWLRNHGDDRLAYEVAKRDAATGFGDVQAYNGRKQAVIRDIYSRIFIAAGLVGGASS